MGLCVLRSKSVKMSRFLSSGRRRVTSSSSVTRPRSTHCNAATVVMSLVHEARQKVASASSGTSKPFSFTKRVPNGFWKCALPVHSQSPWSSGVKVKGICTDQGHLLRELHQVFRSRCRPPSPCPQRTSSCRREVG